MNTKMDNGPHELGIESTEAPGESVPGLRAERRIAVLLPLKLRRRNERGVTIEEETSSENVCRSGAAFVRRESVEIGADVEILIPFSNRGARRRTADFETRARVVHICNAAVEGMKLVGVRFTGPRLRRGE